jgi:hypothetical protein
LPQGILRTFSPHWEYTVDRDRRPAPRPKVDEKKSLAAYFAHSGFVGRRVDGERDAAASILLASGTTLNKILQRSLERFPERR